MKNQNLAALLVLSNLVVLSGAIASTEPANTALAPTAVSAPASAAVVAAPETLSAQSPAAAQPAVQPAENRPADPPYEAPLESQLDQLQMPANMAPASVAQERLYSVQSRFSPLKHRSEVTVGGAYNFRGNGFLTMSSVNLDYRFHLSDRWSLNLGGAYAFNSLSGSGEQLVQQEKRAPDVSYPKYKGHFLIGFNTLYGKIRTSMDSNAYFDQYIAVGPGMLWTDKGNSPSGILDIGLAFWMKKWGSMRFGVMNELFKEKRMESAALTHHIIGHIDFGFMFGGGAE